MGNEQIRVLCSIQKVSFSVEIFNWSKAGTKVAMGIGGCATGEFIESNALRTYLHYCSGDFFRS